MAVAARFYKTRSAATEAVLGGRCTSTPSAQAREGRLRRRPPRGDDRRHPADRRRPRIAESAAPRRWRRPSTRRHPSRSRSGSSGPPSGASHDRSAPTSGPGRRTGSPPPRRASSRTAPRARRLTRPARSTGRPGRIMLPSGTTTPSHRQRGGPPTRSWAARENARSQRLPAHAVNRGGSSGLEARARHDPGHRRRPRKGVLYREGRLRRRSRPPRQRRAPVRAADAARLCLLDRIRHRPERVRARFGPGAIVVADATRHGRSSPGAGSRSARWRTPVGSIGPSATRTATAGPCSSCRALRGPARAVMGPRRCPLPSVRPCAVRGPCRRSPTDRHPGATGDSRRFSEDASSFSSSMTPRSKLPGPCVQRDGQQGRPRSMGGPAAAPASAGTTLSFFLCGI